jgi:hypothetical protein
MGSSALDCGFACVVVHFSQIRWLTYCILALLVQVEPQKAGYHDQDFIYPVGYKSSRKYLSVVDPATKCTYYSEVVGGPKDEPVFRVTCEHDSTEPIEEKTADVRIPPSPPCVARSSDWRDTRGSRRCLGAGSAGRARSAPPAAHSVPPTTLQQSISRAAVGVAPRDPRMPAP